MTPVLQPIAYGDDPCYIDSTVFLLPFKRGLVAHPAPPRLRAYGSHVFRMANPASGPRFRYALVNYHAPVACNDANGRLLVWQRNAQLGLPLRQGLAIDSQQALGGGWFQYRRLLMAGDYQVDGVGGAVVDIGKIMDGRIDWADFFLFEVVLDFINRR